MYALGACLYTFIFGRIPFNAPNVFKLFQVVQHEPLRFPETPVVSSDLKDLLLKMLCKVGPLEHSRPTHPLVLVSWPTQSWGSPLPHTSCPCIQPASGICLKAAVSPAGQPGSTLGISHHQTVA